MRQAVVGALAVALAGTAFQAAGRTPDDDLAVVKKAVAASPAQASPAPAPSPVARAGREPRWFKVRVVDRVSGRKKVTVNLPLTLVRALGDDTIEWGCRDRGLLERCRHIRLSEVLRSLEAGQELVQIEDEEASVRVWVE